MISMTMQHLGGQPGRARLGAVALCHQHRLQAAARRAVCHSIPVIDMATTGTWREDESVFARGNAGSAANANVGRMGTCTTTGFGYRWTKRPTRHLGTRST